MPHTPWSVGHLLPCSKCWTFCHHNPVSADWLCCMPGKFGSVTMIDDYQKDEMDSPLEKGAGRQMYILVFLPVSETSYQPCKMIHFIKGGVPYMA